MKFKLLSLTLFQFAVARFLQSQDKKSFNGTMSDHVEEITAVEPMVCLVEVDDQVYRLTYSETNFMFVFAPNDTLEFNTCEVMKANNKTSATFARRCGSSHCIALTNGVLEDMDVSKVSGNLVMTRNSHYVCGDNPARNESFMLELICGPEKTPAYVDSYSDPCTVHIQLQTKMGCPVYSWTLLKHLIGTILIMIGLILTICGKFTQRWLLQVLIPLLIFVSAIEICAAKGFLNQESTVANFAIFAVVVFISMGVGSWLGRAMQKSIRLGPTIIGSLLGAVFAILLMPFVEAVINYLTPFQMGPTLAGVITVLGILFGTYAGFRLSFLVMLSTQAFISAYSLVRGVSLILGGFPSEMLIIKDLFGFTSPEGADLQPDLPFLLYLSAIGLLSVLSLKYQMKSIFKASTGAKHFQEEADTND